MLPFASRRCCGSARTRTVDTVRKHLTFLDVGHVRARSKGFTVGECFPGNNAMQPDHGTNSLQDGKDQVPATDQTSLET